MTATYLGVFVSAILISFLLTRAVRNLANTRGWVYAPASSRHIHTDLIPRLGGIAIFIAFAVVAVVMIFVAGLRGIEAAVEQRTVLGVLGPATLVFLLGLYDDFRPVRPSVKFAVQAAAATMLYFGGFRVFKLPLLFGSYEFGWLGLPLTILWVLWITNAFNLLDGVDGLAAGSALFSTVTVFVVSLVSGNLLLSVLTLALAGSILGFLRFNFNPATIFLGDSGSLFIGFMLSALALVGAQKAPTLVAVAIPIVSFGLPVLETLLSVLRRFLSGDPLFAADRGHIHHKLLERGFSQQKVVVILYTVSAVCGLLSMFLLYPSGPMLGVVLFVIGAGVWVGVQHLGYHEFVELGRVAHRTIEQKRIIVNNLAIRRGSAALLKANDSAAIKRVLQEAFLANDFDGFELKLAPLSAAAMGRSWFTWNKYDEDNESGEWRLTLELTTADGSLGTFSLSRKCGHSPLLVDINLLTSGFNVALAEALHRLAHPALASMPQTESFARMLANADDPNTGLVASGQVM